MDARIKKINSPEEDELELKRIELAKLSELLADKELELTTLRNSVLHFEYRYFKEVGIKYVELMKSMPGCREDKEKTHKMLFLRKSRNVPVRLQQHGSEFNSYKILKKISKDFKPSEERNCIVKLPSKSILIRQQVKKKGNIKQD
jgi:hypothetical protein